MKKKVLLFTSIGALFLVGVSAVAISGANQLDRLQVKADPTEYSVTFDAESSIEEHNDDGSYAICETTENGNKLGVAGRDKWDPLLSFHGTNFRELDLHDDSNALVNNDADDFDHITGYMISFEGGSLFFKMGLDPRAEGSSVTSGVKYDVSLTPDDYPTFTRTRSEYEEVEEEGIVTISSLTIWYSC